MAEDFGKFLEELKSRVDIVRVVGKYVPLEHKGRLYWGRCPFHGEKTPSFAVNEIDGYYHCFGCKAGGDVIKFVEEIESTDFMGAISILAEQAGMQVPAFSGGEHKDDIEERKKRRDRLLACLKDTARYYSKNLFSNLKPEANDYLAKRQVPQDVARRFGLGASLGYNELPKYLFSLGYTETEMLESGVCKKKDNLYDTIAGRLAFPIIDVMGNVVGFSGRILDNGKFAKYLNTAETMLFSKGKTLYAINLVKKKKQAEATNAIKYMLIVEGQMDVVSLHKAGFDTAVASMGTALTSDQAKLLKRFSDNVLICYDGDFAGQKATLRGLDILKAEGLNIKVMNLPEGMDPDDVINKMGREGFVKLMREAMPLTDFKLEVIRRQCDMKTREGRTKFVENALLVLKELSSEVEREVYIPLVAEMSNTNIDFLRRQMGGIEGASALSNPQVFKNSREKVEAVDNALAKAQKFVLSCMLHLKPFAHFQKDVTFIFKGEEFVEFARAIEAARGSVSTAQMIERCKAFLGGNFQEDFDELITYAYANGSEENEAKYFKDCLWVVYKSYLESHLQQLNTQLEGEVDNTKRKEILTEITSTINKIKAKKVEL